MYEIKERAYYEDSLFRIHLLNETEVSSDTIKHEYLSPGSELIQNQFVITNLCII